MKKTTVCRTGPTCRLHGNKAPRSFIQELQEHARKNSLLETRGLQNQDQDQFKCLYEASLRLWDGGDAGLRSAVKSYQLNSYLLTNSYLRKQDDGLRDVLTENGTSGEYIFNSAKERTERLIRNIDAAFAKHAIPLDEQPVYRSVTPHMSMKQNETLLEYAKRVHPVGSTVTDKAYMSTSSDPDFMLMQARNDRDKTHPFIVYEIEAKAGMPVFPKNLIAGEEDRPHTTNKYSQMQNYEREVMLNRNSRFTVVSVQEIEFTHGYSQQQINEMRNRWDIPKSRTFTVVKLQQQ